MAALELRVVSLNFVSGLDQKTDPKLTTKLTTADNVVLRKNGTIEKRPGYVADGGWSISCKPVRIFPFNNSEFCVSDWSTDNVSASSDTTVNGIQRVQSKAGSDWATQNQTELLTIQSIPFYSDINSITGLDSVLIGASATQQGVALGHFVGSSGHTVAAMDIDTRAIVSTSVPAYFITKVATFSATSLTAYTVSISASNGDVKISAFNRSGSQVSSTVVAAALNTSFTQLDAIGIGSKIYFTGVKTDTQLLVGSFDVSNSATTLTTIAASTTNPQRPSFATPVPGTDRIRMFWAGGSSGTAMRYATFSMTLSQIQSTTAIVMPSSISLIAGVAPQWFGACENTGATYSSLYITSQFGNTSISSALFRTVWAGDYSDAGVSLLNNGAQSETAAPVMRMSAKPFVAHGVPHIAVSHSNLPSKVIPQPFTAIYRRSGGHYLASGRVHYGVAVPNVQVSFGVLPIPMSYDGDVFYMPARKANYFRASSGSITVAYSVDLLKLNFSQTQQLPYAQIGGDTYVGGGILMEADGGGFTEAGFWSDPLIVHSSTTSSGGAMTAGLHAAVVVKEYCNQQGKMYIGTPSVPMSFTVSANGSATVYFVDWPGIRNTELRKDSTRYVVYVTTANGSIYYRTNSFLTGIDSPSVFGYSLSNSDAVISGGDVLYTQGGLLPNWTPDSVGVLCAHRGRLFCDDPSDDLSIRYSQLIVSGQGLQFAAVNKIPIDGVGRVSAMASMDSQLIVFKERKIYAIAGDGPDDTGLNGSFDARLVFDEIGCVNQRNLCRFNDGIAFKSPDKGFYLLTRDLQLNFIGAAVQDYNSKTVVSSEVVAMTEASGAVEECRFLCSDGTLLTYNYYNGQWTTATLAGCTDAIQTGGRYVIVNTSSTAASARVFQQSLSTYTDAFSNTSTTYQMTIETGFVKTADVQGFQRIWKVQGVGDSQGAGRISVEVGYDYETAYNEAYTFSMSSMTTPNYTGGAQSSPQFDFVPVRQKCQAVRFRIKDYPTDNGAVMKLTNISLECGVKGGMFKLPAAKGT